MSFTHINFNKNNNFLYGTTYFSFFFQMSVFQIFAHLCDLFLVYAWKYTRKIIQHTFFCSENDHGIFRGKLVSRISIPISKMLHEK